MDDLHQKIELQNKQVQEMIEKEKSNQEQISKQIDEEVEKLNNSIRQLNDINSQKMKNPLTFGLSKKINELNLKMEKNQENIKKNLDKIPDILRKKKESEEFFTKFMGEKKVWLDRLVEKELQNLAFQTGFKYLYEAKTIKLLMEGILLQKVQDEVEKELTKKGELFGWNIMDVEKYDSKKKQEEFELNLELLKVINIEEVRDREKEFKEKCEREDKDLKIKRSECQKEWKELWGQIWVPSVAYTGDESIINKRKMVQLATMDVTFRLFKQLMFDVWKFKNVLNNTNQFIILEKIKKYLNETDENLYNINHIMVNNQRKDEDAFDKMTSIIEGLRREEEIIYCDLVPAKKKLEEIKKSSEGSNNSSIERISDIIEKIEDLQKKVEKEPELLIKREVEELHVLIKNLPDEHEKKLFRDNLKDESRLYDIFLPLTTLLMIMTFLSVGQKRTKNYEKQLDEIKEENEKLELENEEIKGKLNTLNDINSKVENKDKEINGAHEFNEVKNSLNELTKLVISQKDDINKQQNILFDDIKNSLVKI